MIKKFILAVLVVLSVLLAVSCQTVSDDDFRNIYNQYFGNIDLQGAQKYTVKTGDRLTTISGSLYENGFYYPVIMLASRDVVVDPDKIKPGMVLTIPDLKRNLNNPTAKASIKGVITDCAKIEGARDRVDTAKGLRAIASSL